MGRIEIAFLALGGTLVTLGAGLVFVPAAPIVAGVLLIVAGLPRDKR